MVAWGLEAAPGAAEQRRAWRTCRAAASSRAAFLWKLCRAVGAGGCPAALLLLVVRPKFIGDRVVAFGDGRAPLFSSSTASWAHDCVESLHSCHPAGGSRPTAAAGGQRKGAEARIIVFKMNHKTASRTVPAALRAQGYKVEIVQEWEGLHPHLAWRGLGHHNAFVIGTVRNPCDWYVSKWKWGCDWPKRKGSALEGNQLQEWSRNCAVEGWATSEESPARFRGWLTTGRYYMARLMYNNYVEEGWYNLEFAVTSSGDAITSGKCAHPPLMGCRPDWDRPDRDTFKPSRVHGEQVPWICSGDNKQCRPNTGKMELVGSFEPDLVDCWARLTSLTADLGECMRRWSGKPEQKQLPEEPHIHSISSLPCEAFWADDIKAGVMQTDKAIFDAFGYTTCCGAPTVDRFP